MSTEFGLHTCETAEIRISTVQKLRGPGIDCDSKLLDGKMCIRVKKSWRSKRENQDGTWRIYMLYDRRRKIL